MTNDFPPPVPFSKVCCIGAGYVGGSSCTVFAQQCPDVTFTVVDNCEERIAQWNSENIPIYEVGLYEIIEEARGRNLFFSTDTKKAIQEADLIFICVNTPTKACGLGKGRASDLTNLEAAARLIAAVATTPKVVVEKSTVPVRAAEAVSTILHGSPCLCYGMKVNSDNCVKTNGECDKLNRFVVLSNPEFLSEGTSVNDLLCPDRVLIGGDCDSPNGRLGVGMLTWLYLHWIPQDQLLLTSTWSSELSKLAANAFLAQRISSINAISSLCEATGADVREVAKAVGLDHRIGPHFLNVSPGFGGSCFQKDLLNLVYLCESLQLPEAGAYWYSVVHMNNYQRTRFSRRIVECMNNTLRNKRIAVFGFAFKKNTRDTRESSSIYTCATLIEEGAYVAIFDPQVTPAQIKYDLEEVIAPERVAKQVIICSSAKEAANQAYGIAVCTEWDEFCNLDYSDLYANMQQPAHIFDGRLILNHANLMKIGFKVYAIGVSSEQLKHETQRLNNGVEEKGDFSESITI